MDLGTLLRTIARRWYVTIPALLLVGVVALVVVDTSEPEYAAQRSVVLVRTGLIPQLDDELGDEETPRNPYAEFNASVTVTAEVLQDVVQSGESRRVLREEGLSDDYSVDVAESAPILEIEALAGSPDVAIASAERVAQLVTDDLAARQENFDVPDDSRIVTDNVVVPEQTTRLDTSRDRALIGLAVLGVIFIVVVGLLADVIARARAARRDRRSEESLFDDPRFDEEDEAVAEVADPRQADEATHEASDEATDDAGDDQVDADRARAGRRFDSSTDRQSDDDLEQVARQ